MDMFKKVFMYFCNFSSVQFTYILNEFWMKSGHISKLWYLVSLYIKIILFHGMMMTHVQGRNCCHVLKFFVVCSCCDLKY
jgi:hypothetical protein